ncbi:hypothetical protein FLONG3_7216 [Fusarium longipes]|uniref:Uncharacterized protein n=1 Tax=Fusarium longipes TaxID=694270 RepID=A0A395SFV2_9HYPO|nr:hypothetical protein FLONG3_7216 [Fusarium longipes]
MKHSLLLALWSAGALGGPCKPARDVTRGNYDLPPVPSTYLLPTQSGQDTAVQTHTAGGSDGNEDVSETIYSTQTLTDGSMTVIPVPGSQTTATDGEIPEASQASDAAGISGSPTSGSDEPSEGGEGTASPTNVSDQPDQSGGDNSGTMTTVAGGDGATQLPETGTLTDIAGQPSGDAGNTGSPSQGSSLADAVGATQSATTPGQTNGGDTGIETSVFGGDATQFPETGTATDVNGQPSGDADNTVPAQSDASSPADSVGATETATPLPVETDSPGANTETNVDGALPTEGTPGTISPGEPSGHATESATNGAPDVPGTTDAADSTQTGSPGSPDETIPAPGNAVTGTDEGEESSHNPTNTVPGETEGSGDVTVPATTNAGGINSETSIAGVGNTSQDISETTGTVPEQSSENVPGNTNVNEQTTQSVSDDLPVPTETGESTKGESETISTNVNDAPTGAATGSETTGDSPEQTQDNGSNETTHLTQADTSAVVDTTTDGAQPTETDISTQPDATTLPAADNSDTTSVDASSEIEGPSTAIGVTTAEAASTTDGSNDTPSTTVKDGDSPPVTQSPAPVTTTAPGDESFPTVTEAPDGFSTTVVGNHPEWTTNTWITTTSDDSSEPTIVPVLVGCKNCGGSGSGIILWNWPKVPDTWFQLPGLPKFTFPCIPPGCTTPPTTSESDSDGENESDKPSSTTCTDKATVTDCFVACTTYTGPAGASITPECSTTCTATHTGCSVTGTTTTSSAAACGPSGDSSCIACMRSEISETDPDSLERRGLKKRAAAAPQKMLGGCAMTNIQPTFPEYPGGELVLDNDADIISRNSPLKDIKRWWLTTTDSQCLPVLSGHLDAATYKLNRVRAKNQVPSIDHVYEKSMLLDFFRAIVDPNGPAVKGATTGAPRTKINCQDLEAYGGTASKNNKQLLQKVFDAYPGSVRNRKDKIMVNKAQYLDDFIGMDQWTNGNAKGDTTNAEVVKKDSTKLVDTTNDVTAATTEKDAKKTILEKIEFLEKLAIGVEMMNEPEATQALIRQNQRIYARFIDMDNEAKGCMNDPAVKNGLWSFADAYKKFMQTRFDGKDPWSINNEVADAKTKILNKLSTDLAAAANIQPQSATFAATLSQFNNRYNNMADFNRQWAVIEPNWVWTWVKKRDGEDSGLSCDRPIDSDTTTSEEPTTFATSTRTSSEESSSEVSTSSDETTSSTEDTTSSEMITSTTEEPIQLTGFPTLTNAPPLSISTPDGSSCASTATYTQCNLGTGHHGEACVINSQCASWVNTETTSTTPTPTPTMDTPDPALNEKHCYNDGPKTSYNAITVNAESFCRDVVSYKRDNGYYWSNDKLDTKKNPGDDPGYHYKVLFQVKEGCLWKADFDECMRYMKVPIDSCNCSAKGNKQGGWVENNCIVAKIEAAPGH